MSTSDASSRARIAGPTWSLPVLLAAALSSLLVVACQRAPVPPSVVFTTIPEASVGGSERMRDIAGRGAGAAPDDRLVLYARSGVWWVQPLVTEPFTTIRADGTWRSTTHLGTDYAALLVGPSFRPQATLDHLPTPGGDVRAVAVAAGRGDTPLRPVRSVSFSGYEWEVRNAPSDRGGSNVYDERNVSVDAQGRLHLRLTRRDGRWTGAEVSLGRSLGYGTYVFVTSDTSQMDPSAVLGLLTWDDGGAEQNHRELDVEISRWGDSRNDNAQFVVQPYYVPANVRRFAAPAGRLTHTLRWTPGAAAFRTTTDDGRTVAAHEFTSGVPVPGNERVRMHVYAFGFSSRSVRDEVEVAVEKFQYLP